MRSPSTYDKDGVEEYEVEHILDNQVFRNKLEYLVCWMGYGIEEDEWRLVKDIKGARRMVVEFHRRNPEVPQYISSLNFASLLFHPMANFTDTPDMVPSGWAISCHTLGQCAFKGGVNVRVCPQEHPIATHCPSSEPS